MKDERLCRLEDVASDMRNFVNFNSGHIHPATIDFIDELYYTLMDIIDDIKKNGGHDIDIN